MNQPHMKYREGAECELAADLQLVESALAELRTYLRDRGFPTTEWDGLQLAAAEAFNNAIIHGCRDRPDGTVLIRWNWTIENLEIRVRDPGHFEPPATWAELPEDPLAEGGRGGFLISSYFDEVVHSNDDRGHEIAMTKVISVASQPPYVAGVEDELQLMTQDLSDSYESLAALFNISALLATSTTFDDFLQGVLAKLRELLAADLTYARLHDTDGKWEAHYNRKSDAVSAPAADLSPLEEQVWSARTLQSLESTEDLSDDEPLKTWSSGVVICPIGFQAASIGLIICGRREGAPFTAGQTNLIRTIADFVGIGYTTAELHRQREEQLREMKELEIAAEIQRSLLPTTIPSTAHWAVHGACESARAVGGDYWDAILCEDGNLVVIIADVMGKGVPAAMFASILRASVRARLDLAADPGRLLTVLNCLLADDLGSLGMFITVQIVTLDPAGQHIDIANAGHTPPLIFAPGDEQAREIPTVAEMPLGIMPDTVYDNTRITLVADEVLVFGTDGLYELEDAQGEMLGIETLASRLPQWWTGQIDTFVAATLTHLRLIERDRQSDDRTMVTITRPPPTP